MRLLYTLIIVISNVSLYAVSEKPKTEEEIKYYMRQTVLPQLIQKAKAYQIIYDYKIAREAENKACEVYTSYCRENFKYYDIKQVKLEKCVFTCSLKPMFE